MTITPISKEKLEELKTYAQICDTRAESCILSAYKLKEVIALAERALQPQTPMDVTVYTLERLRGAMTRFGISCGEGGMEHFSVKFESHLLEFIRAATDSLDKLRQAYADLEASQRAPQPEEDAFMADVKKLAASVLGDCYLGKLDEEELAAKVKKAASQLALPAGAVPAGSRLVPIEPRPECCDEGKDGSEVCCGNGKCAYLQEVESARAAVATVLASLPSTPAGPVPDEQAEHRAALQYVAMGDTVIDQIAATKNRQNIYRMFGRDATLAFVRAIEFEVLARCCVSPSPAVAQPVLETDAVRAAVAAASALVTERKANGGFEITLIYKSHAQGESASEKISDAVFSDADRAPAVAQPVAAFMTEQDAAHANGENILSARHIITAAQPVADERGQVTKAAAELLEETVGELKAAHTNPITGQIDDAEVLDVISQHEFVIHQLHELCQPAEEGGKP